MKIKKIVGILTVCALCMGLISTAALAVENSTDKVYTIDLNNVPEQEFNNSKIKIVFEVPDRITVEGNEKYGYPIRLDISSLNGGVTFIPLKLVADALNVPVEWVEKTPKEEAHAIITTANHGTVNLYMGATSITASDGTLYEEATYKFPDGTSIPLILVRNGRLYVPVRFLSTFVLGNVQFEWGANATILYIKGQNDEISKGFEGVGANMDLNFNPEDPFADMPNAKIAADKYGSQGTLSPSGNALFVNGVGIRNTGAWLEITGFAYSANDAERYDIVCSLIKDSCDKESADALIKWLDELNVKRDACVAGTLSKEDFDKYYYPVVSQNKETTFGNINVSFEVNDVGGISSINITK